MVQGNVGIRWDGRNLAVIQMATCKIPRRAGRPAAEVDEDWNLTILDQPVPRGHIVSADGAVLGPWMEVP